MNYDKCKVSLDLAKALKSVDYPQEQSEWCWIEHTANSINNPPRLKQYDDKHYKEFVAKYNYIYAAPSVAELGEMLPADVLGEIGKDSITYGLYSSKLDDDDWEAIYMNPHYDSPLITIGGKTEADARAKMWLWLKKNKYLDERR